jgi:hypothetical protein
MLVTSTYVQCTLRPLRRFFSCWSDASRGVSLQNFYTNSLFPQSYVIPIITQVTNLPFLYNTNLSAYITKFLIKLYPKLWAVINSSVFLDLLEAQLVYGGRDSVLLTATRYALQGPGFEPCWGKVSLLCTVQTGSEARTASSVMWTGDFIRA